MLRVTFYGYRGGSGRTSALLNVAAWLAAHGRKVVAVDMDLEAPGFGLSSLTGRNGGEVRPGVSDFIFAAFEPGELTAEPYLFSAPVCEAEGRLLLMPAGTRAVELSSHIAEFYRDPAGPLASVFSLLVAKIAEYFDADYMFFDSPTGLADIAGICTVELPQVLVVLTGLGAQGIYGTKQVLEQLRTHPARVHPVATMVVLSPVPRAKDLGVATIRETMRRRTELGMDTNVEREGNILFDSIARAHGLLMPIVLEDLHVARTRFNRLEQSDLFLGLEYDPELPLREKLHVLRPCQLAADYCKLARSITRAHPTDSVLEGGGEALLGSGGLYRGANSTNSG